MPSPQTFPSARRGAAAPPTRPPIGTGGKPAAYKPEPTATWKMKLIVMAAAIAAVTIVGAVYGAGLKIQQEQKAEKVRIIEATPEQRIAGLEQRKSYLKAQRIPLQRKLDEARGKMGIERGQSHR